MAAMAVLAVLVVTGGGWMHAGRARCGANLERAAELCAGDVVDVRDGEVGGVEQLAPLEAGLGVGGADGGLGEISLGDLRGGGRGGRAVETRDRRRGDGW